MCMVIFLIKVFNCLTTSIKFVVVTIYSYLVKQLNSFLHIVVVYYAKYRCGNLCGGNVNINIIKPAVVLCRNV